GHIGMRNLVDDADRGFSRENGVEVHLLDRDAPVARLAPRNDLETLDEQGRLLSTVGLHVADDDVDASLLQGVRFFQHAVRLADPRRKTEVELETTSPGSFDELEE